MKQRCLSNDFIAVNDSPEKCCHAFLCEMGKEGKRANYRRDREKMSVGDRASEKEEMASVQRSIHLHKNIMEI